MGSGLREGDGPSTSQDGAFTIVGDKGAAALQDGDQLVVKTGVGGEQRDYDINSEGITDTDDVVLASPNEIGGTAELSGALESDNGEPFQLKIVWQDDDEADLYTESFSADTDFLIEAVTTKSDNVEIRVDDESAQGTANAVTGTLNFHA